MESLAAVGKALNLYLRHVSDAYILCEKHFQTAAIHKGKELQVYRMFERGEAVSAHVRRCGAELPSWEELPYWKAAQKKLLKLKNEVIARMEKHSKLHPFFTKGIVWEARAILIHGYKFEPDQGMKIELILPQLGIESLPEELPLQRIASALRCHEYLVPDHISTARPPYERHETEFWTVFEYLRRTMPKDTYATQYLTIHRAGDG